MKYIITILAAMFMTGAAFANEGAATTQSAKPAVVKKAKKANVKKKKAKKAEKAEGQEAPKADEHKAEGEAHE